MHDGPYTALENRVHHDGDFDVAEAFGISHSVVVRPGASAASSCPNDPADTAATPRLLLARPLEHVG